MNQASELLDPMHRIGSLPVDCRDAAQLLNSGCTCAAVDHARLSSALAIGGEPLLAGIAATRPHLFSDSMVFVGEAHLQRMASIIAAVESVVALPAYRETVLGRSGMVAQVAPKAAGVFMGYDFHLFGGDDPGPRLIEINTNAGGGLLSAKLLSARRTCACCEAIAARRQFNAEAVEAAYVAMFREEWRLERGDAPQRRNAIVDDNPREQYLAAEFELFRRLFIAHGIDAVIVDPGQLDYLHGRLEHAGKTIDLVYNRLTDFSLAAPSSAMLRAAYLDAAVVLTPHPHAHALHADKRNLVLLSDANWLREAGVPADVRDELVRGIPTTLEVTAAQADRFWRERRRWFFKPAAGFGGRAAYRGDKLTRGVFESIVAGGYIAQAVVAPSERSLRTPENAQSLKLDLRNYAYQGQVQLVAARLYQGQTTNFRTPGGGFASVLPVRRRDVC